MKERKQGHSALRVKNGEIETFDPHPAYVVPDTADWWRVVAQRLSARLHAAEEVIDAWRLFTVGQSSKVRPERMMKEYLSTPQANVGSSLLRKVDKAQECEFCYDILPSHKSNCRMAAKATLKPCPECGKDPFENPICTPEQLDK